MNITEALNAIAKVADSNEYSLSTMAKNALLSDDKLVEIVQYVNDRYGEGSASNLAAVYGFKPISIVLHHAKVINARADIQCQDICLLMGDISLN